MSKANDRSRMARCCFWAGFAVVFVIGFSMYLIGPSPGIVSCLYVAAALGVSGKRDLERYRASKNKAKGD